ncbi:hypothetical protein JVT61DRAFT_3774 [Boletus reticuloceps]|uniref:Uncharacterized protein n=1 Tax=Boletus reticuloceps TaxID=495285 RepID=A0A8I2YN85_9AGAM|nr:hypothetical protein JVT61DRAFT_3774 [Boletus reticuloceps]
MASSVSTSSSKKYSRTPDKCGQSVKKHKKHVSKSKNKPDSDPEESQNSSGDPDHSGSESESDLGVDPVDCKVAGRVIARCHDMFADVKKIIDIMLLVKQAEAAKNRDLSEPEDEGVREHRDNCLGKITAKTIV